MKKILFSLSLSIASLYATPPSWYTQNNITHTNYEYIGYGSAKSKAEAKQIAKGDIANSMHTSISSSIELKKSSGSNYSKTFSQNITQKSDIVLDDISVIKSDYIDGYYYIAVKYTNLPFAKKVRSKFSDIEGIAKEHNNYLINTMLLKELKDEFGFYPKVSISKGTLNIGNHSFRITQEILKKLFSSRKNQNIILSMPSSLRNNEYYFVDIVTKIKGYLTLIQIYEDGQTSVLFSNKKVTQNIHLEYPNKDQYDGLQAYLNDNQTKTKDMTMVIVCEDKKDFDYFDRISIHNEKYAKVYGKIFDMIGDCTVSSSIIEIRK